MPRRARLDAPGALHHVMVRGIERRRIVNDVADRKNFEMVWPKARRSKESLSQLCQKKN
jgi:hypothetical protein